MAASGMCLTFTAACSGDNSTTSGMPDAGSVTEGGASSGTASSGMASSGMSTSGGGASGMASSGLGMLNITCMSKADCGSSSAGPAAVCCAAVKLTGGLSISTACMAACGGDMLHPQLCSSSAECLGGGNCMTSPLGMGMICTGGGGGGQDAGGGHDAGATSEGGGAEAGGGPEGGGGTDAAPTDAAGGG